MFDLELEWTEGVGGGERPHPPFSALLFDRYSPPWNKFLSLPSLSWQVIVFQV